MPNSPIEANFEKYHLKTFVQPIAPRLMVSSAAFLVAGETLRTVLLGRVSTPMVFGLSLSFIALIGAIRTQRHRFVLPLKQLRFEISTYVLCLSLSIAFAGLNDPDVAIIVLVGSCLGALSSVLFWMDTQSFVASQVATMLPSTIVYLREAGGSQNVGIALLFVVATFVAGYTLHSNLIRVFRQNHSLALKTWHFANVDSVTGVYNRSNWMAHAERMFDVPQPLFLLFIDMDRFKQINDTYGHLRGDQVLRRAAQAIRERTPENGRLGRLGGDEFGVILAGGTRADAEAVATSIREHLMRIRVDDRPLNVSIGISYRRDTDRLAIMLGRADAANLFAKRTGRDRIAWFTDIDDLPPQDLAHLLDRGYAMGDLSTQPRVTENESAKAGLLPTA